MRRYLITFLLIAPVLLGSLFIYRAVVFRVTDTSPQNGARNASAYDDISLSFNQPLSKFGSISANNQLDVAGKITGKKLAIIPKSGLVVDRHYVIKVTGIVSTSNKEIASYELTFDVKDVAFNDLSDATKAKVRGLGEKHIPTNPHQAFISSLPYTSAAFDISFVTDPDGFLVQIKQAPVDVNRQAATDYLGKNGVNENNAVINFFVLPYLENKAGP